MTKPKPTPHTTPTPVTLSRVITFELSLCLCVCTASRAPIFAVPALLRPDLGGLFVPWSPDQAVTPASQYNQILILDVCHGRIFRRSGIKFAEI